MKVKRPTLKTILKAAWIFYGCLSFIIWIPKADQLLSKDYPTMSECILLDDAWDIAINDDIYRDVSLDDFRFEVVSKGDQIVMQRVLPADWSIVEGALRLHIRQSAVRMYIDDEMVYEYGYDRIAKNKTVGSGFQFINFPQDYQGKTLKIHLYLSEDRAFAKLDSIRIYEWQNAYRVLMTENRLPLLLGSFLLIFGLSTCVITVVAVAFSIKYLRLLCVSIFSICVGLWTLCYYNVILVFSIPLHQISMMEYLALYLSPIPLVIYMREDVMNLGYKAVRICYHVLLTVQVSAITIMIALHTMDIVHCAAMLPYMHILIIICLIYFTIVVVMNLKNNRKANRLFLIGMLVIAGCISYDLVSYLENRYMGQSILNIRGVSSIGMMIFIFILIISFYIKLTQKMIKVPHFVKTVF